MYKPPTAVLHRGERPSQRGFYFILNYVYMCVHVGMCTWIQVPVEAIREYQIPEMGVIERYESTAQCGARYQTWVLCKSSMSSSAVSTTPASGESSWS